MVIRDSKIMQSIRTENLFSFVSKFRPKSTDETSS